MNLALRVRPCMLLIQEISGSRSEESGSKCPPCTHGKHLAEGMDASLSGKFDKHYQMPI